MTPLRQRFIEDMQLRGLAPTTQRSYIHYVAEFAKFYGVSPEKLDLEAVRQYELYLIEQRKLSAHSINTFVSAIQFLYVETLEMPWGKSSFPRQHCPDKQPVVLSPEEVARFFRHVPSLKYRAALMTWNVARRGALQKHWSGKVGGKIDEDGWLPAGQREVRSGVACS